MKRWIHAETELYKGKYDVNNMTLEEIQKIPDNKIQYEIAEQTDNIDLIEGIIDRGNIHTQLGVMDNPNLPYDMLVKLCDSPYPSLRFSLARHLHDAVDEYIVEKLVSDPSKRVSDAAKKRLAYMRGEDSYNQNKQSNPRYFRYIVYECDPEDFSEVDSIKDFSSSKLNDAITYANKYADRHNVPTHVVAVPNPDKEGKMQQECQYRNNVPAPFSVVWESWS